MVPLCLQQSLWTKRGSIFRTIPAILGHAKDAKSFISFGICYELCWNCLTHWQVRLACALPFIEECGGYIEGHHHNRWGYKSAQERCVDLCHHAVSAEAVYTVEDASACLLPSVSASSDWPSASGWGHLWHSRLCARRCQPPFWVLRQFAVDHASLCPCSCIALRPWLLFEACPALAHRRCQGVQMVPPRDLVGPGKAESPRKNLCTFH